MRLDAIYEADPGVGEEIRKRFETVQSAWPEVENRFLKDREKADLVSLLPGGHLAPRKGSRAVKP